MKKILVLISVLVTTIFIQAQNIELPEMLRDIGIGQEKYTLAVQENWKKICELNGIELTDINFLKPGESLILPDLSFYKIPVGEHAWRAAELYTIGCFMVAYQEPEVKKIYDWLPPALTFFFFFVYWSMSKRPKTKKISPNKWAGDIIGQDVKNW